MLEFEVFPDGGVRISGSSAELDNLIEWIERALQQGRAWPAFAADQGLTTVEIVCVDDL